MISVINDIVICTGLLISIALLYVTLKIVHKSRDVRGIASTETETIIQKELARSSEIVSDHFITTVFPKVSAGSRDSKRLLELFHSEWNNVAELTGLFTDYHTKENQAIFGRRELNFVLFYPLLQEHMNYLIIKDSLINRLKKNDELYLIRESVHTYFLTVKFIFLIVKLKEMQSDLDLKPMRQEFLLDDIRFKLDEDSEGFEEITVQ